MIGDNDFEDFFCTEEFAENAVLNGETVQGIFTNAYAGDSFGQVSIENTSATFILPTKDVPTGVEGMTLTARGVNYFVHRAEPDGTGITTLVLGNG